MSKGHGRFGAQRAVGNTTEGMRLPLATDELAAPTTTVRRIQSVATYKELLARKQELDAEIERARQAEAQVALASVRETIAAFGFTAEDLFGTRRKSRGASNGAPRFRHPETGETWGGRGPRPRWLKGKDPEQFRVRD
jgi:DNA-binding protein H-NS